jgi:hypothetical protein
MQTKKPDFLNFGKNLQIGKFVSSSIQAILMTFKTDRHTLADRLDIQKGQRDKAESNMEVELRGLKSDMQKLLTSGQDSRIIDCVDTIQSIQTQLDVVQQSASRICSAAEVSLYFHFSFFFWPRARSVMILFCFVVEQMYGQVQQENKVSKVIDILMAFVENQKRTYEREHAELKELRYVLYCIGLDE